MSSIKETRQQLVSLPRTTDALGKALRHVFGVPAIPHDMADLLHRLDNAPAR